jgi:hypothetical protein
MSEVKSTAVIVLGVHRGGTSAVGGVIHNLGIPMVGDEENMLGPGVNEWHNPKGYFEDREFLRLNERVIGRNWKNPQVVREKETLDDYREAIAKRLSMPLWGMKDPRNCFTLPIIQELLPQGMDIKVVTVARPVPDIAGGLARRLPEEESWEIAVRYEIHRLRQFLFFKGKKLWVNYNSLIDNTKEEVSRIANFIGVPITDAAVEIVDPTLRHRK